MYIYIVESIESETTSETTDNAAKKAKKESAMRLVVIIKGKKFNS